MRLGIKQVLLLGAVMLGMVGCVEQPTVYHYVGMVNGIDRGQGGCYDVLFTKQDGSRVIFTVNKYPPAWKGMYGDILLKEASGDCGYTMVSAKEEK